MCLTQIESETSNSEKDLNDAMDRLGTLGREINALKTKRANNSMAAARAEETATMARDKANEAKQVCVSLNGCAHFASLKEYSPIVQKWPLTCFYAQILDGQLTDKYHEVQQRVDTKAKAVQDAKKRAESLRDEAKELLRDAQNKLQKLAGAYSYLYVYVRVCSWSHRKDLCVWRKKKEDQLLSFKSRLKLYFNGTFHAG